MVTGITFDGLPGNLATLNNNGDGTWSIVNPAREAGPVGVVVEWTLGGVQQTPITYTDGFTYLAPAVAPTITDPVDQSTAPGTPATFAVAATGTLDVTVTWEVETTMSATGPQTNVLYGIIGAIALLVGAAVITCNQIVRRRRVS